MVDISVPQVNFYGMLSGLGDSIAQGQKEAAKRDFGALLANPPRAKDGSVDWDQVGAAAAKTGADPQYGLALLKLHEEQRQKQKELDANSQFSSALSGMFGLGSGGTARPAPGVAPPPGYVPFNGLGGKSAPDVVPPAATPPAPISRPPVQSSPQVWGDKEAENAGLYEKPVPPAPIPNAPNAAANVTTPQAVPASAPQPGVSFTDATTKPAARQQFTGVQAEHIPVLVAAMGSPYLSTGNREVAGKLLASGLDNLKEPDKIRTLTAIKEQSNYPGTILDLEKELRKASKSDTNVSIDQKGETEEAKSAGKAAGERRADMFASANKATDNLANLTRVQTLLDQVKQGKLEPSRLTVSAWAKSLGVDDGFASKLGLDPKKVGDAQALQALTNELVLGKIGAGGLPANNFSDADRQFLTDTVPKMSNDPRANSIMIEAAKRVQQSHLQRAIDFQQWKNDPANKGKGFEDFETDRARTVTKLDRFGDLRKQAESLLPADNGDTASGTTSGGVKWMVK